MLPGILAALLLLSTVAAAQAQPAVNRQDACRTTEPPNPPFVPPAPYPPNAMMSGIRIPTAGCWELTARYAGHTLSFVVEDVP